MWYIYHFPLQLFNTLPFLGFTFQEFPYNNLAFSKKSGSLRICVLQFINKWSSRMQTGDLFQATYCLWAAISHTVILITYGKTNISVRKRYTLWLLALFTLIADRLEKIWRLVQSNMISVSFCIITVSALLRKQYIEVWAKVTKKVSPLEAWKPHPSHAL